MKLLLLIVSELSRHRALITAGTAVSEIWSRPSSAARAQVATNMRRLIIRCAWFFVLLFGIVSHGFSAPLPEAGAASRERAQRLLAEGVVSEAATVLTHYLRDHANDIGARYDLARILFDLEQYAESFNQLLLIPADDPAYGMARKHLLMRLRMSVARDLDWSDADAVLAFARLCSRMGSYERSARAYRRLLATTSTPTPGLQREYAAVLGWSGDAESAAREWDRYLRMAPEDMDAWHQLARTDMALGRLDDAQRHLESVLERQPGNVAVMLDLARVRIWLGDTKSADRILADLLARNHEPVDVGILRSELLLRLGEVEAAYDVLHHVLKHAPGERRATQMLQELETSRRIDIARLRRRISQEPDNESDRIRLIDILLALDRPGAALREMVALAELRPDDAGIAERIAELEARQQRDIVRMMRRMAGIHGSDRRLEMLKDWYSRHPGDLRAIRYLDRPFLPAHSATPTPQP